MFNSWFEFEYLCENLTKFKIFQEEAVRMVEFLYEIEFPLEARFQQIFHPNFPPMKSLHTFVILNINIAKTCTHSEKSF